MVTINLSYPGDLRVQAKHGPSGVELCTDAPIDNQGKGESFSPTDLLATALGSCMLTIMGISARDKSIPLEGTRAIVEKHMSEDEPRRVSALDVRIEIPHRLDSRAMLIMRKAAETCPVAQSISPDILLRLELVCI